MKDFFLRDSVLKIISFVIALLLWIYIIAVVDPSVDVTVKDIPIRYTNQNMIEDKNLCLINDSKATVELKIRGSRKRIANIDNKNIYATVDLATVGKTGTMLNPGCAIFAELGEGAQIRNVTFADVSYSLMDVKEGVRSVLVAALAKMASGQVIITNVTVTGTMTTNYEGELPRLNEAVFDGEAKVQSSGFTANVTIGN